MFDQRRVTGVEINPSILELVNGRFGDFTGHLDRDPRVRFVNDEARSYLARMRERADIIQISLIDTWAATASGAFVLTENSLYTLEAWTSFLDRLSPRGVLSVSRWYYADRPGEVYRSAVLAAAALQRIGVEAPAGSLRHRAGPAAPTKDAPDGIGTILVSRDPLSAADLDTLEAVAARLKFDIVQSPRIVDRRHVRGHRRRRAPAGAARALSARHQRPDRRQPVLLPHAAPARRLQPAALAGSGHRLVQHESGRRARRPARDGDADDGRVHRLAAASAPGAPDLDGAGPHLVYFAAIGFGFMLIEISQLQRLTIFLGHPAYSLSVVLFSLLVSSGMGSLSTARVRRPAGRATDGGC